MKQNLKKYIYIYRGKVVKISTTPSKQWYHRYHCFNLTAIEIFRVESQFIVPFHLDKYIFGYICSGFDSFIILFH